MDSPTIAPRALLLACIGLALLAAPPDAHALRLSPEQIDTVTQHARSGAPVQPQCGPACTTLRQTD